MLPSYTCPYSIMCKYIRSASRLTLLIACAHCIIVHTFLSVYFYNDPKSRIVTHLQKILCDRKFLSHKTLREDAHLRCHFGRSKSEVHRTSCSLAEMKYMLRIPLGRERVARDSFLQRKNRRSKKTSCSVTSNAPQGTTRYAAACVLCPLRCRHTMS